ncbi:cell division protein ZapB [Deefgea salmonis]|uniref:Cell division protein ZapB n=1 Tax=Deefgea salmonis TaxID=2875502 RepID=A0ABS8BL39_9NEIS|nr:cell division protein ZapB [Deefgea salmonis]MCB5196435.1 hypothetical protein [Deefgea salmonis]
MDVELGHLEGKVLQLVDLCRELRIENQTLRMDLQSAQEENKSLNTKLVGAKDKVNAILAKLPEDGA